MSRLEGAIEWLQHLAHHPQTVWSTKQNCHVLLKHLGRNNDGLSPEDLLEAYDKAAHAYADACHGGDAELRDERLRRLEVAKQKLRGELR